jgi:hypothetical protein
MKNRKAKLMKNLESSDINPMVQCTMNNAAVRLAMPVSTALIWGANAFPGGNSAIWGTSAVGGTKRRQDFSAIWGTSGVWAPTQQAPRPWPSIEIST